MKKNFTVGSKIWFWSGIKFMKGKITERKKLAFIIYTKEDKAPWLKSLNELMPDNPWVRERIKGYKAVKEKNDIKIKALTEEIESARLAVFE